MKYKICLQPFIVEQYYPMIQERMILNQDKIAHFEEYDWFIKMNFKKFNQNIIKKIYNNLKATKAAQIVWKLFFGKK